MERTFAKRRSPDVTHSVARRGLLRQSTAAYSPNGTRAVLATGNGEVGVWGNHDFGLSFEPDTRVRRRYPAEVIDFMTSLRPRLELGGCYFAHIEPWLNPEELCDLWYFDGFTNEPARLQRIFDAVPQRVMFAGHYHRWLLVRPDQITDWLGTGPVDLSSGRAFVVIGAVCDGYSALFDTDTGTLTPFCDTPATLSQEPGSGM